MPHPDDLLDHLLGALVGCLLEQLGCPLLRVAGLRGGCTYLVGVLRVVEQDDFQPNTSWALSGMPSQSKCFSRMTTETVTDPLSRSWSRNPSRSGAPQAPSAGPS